MSVGSTPRLSVDNHITKTMSGGSAPEVSIVIVNWNAKHVLLNCLLSIAEQTRRPYQIVVVDNASTDGSAELIRRDFPTVELIANTCNRGFAAANNQGVRRALGRYVLLLNPDTVILDGAVDEMIDWCDAHPDVGCAGCQVMLSATEIQKTCFCDLTPFSLFLTETGLDRRFNQSLLLGRPSYAWWDRRSEMDVDVVSGMFMLIPRTVLDRVGLMDESFFVYAEEADLCRRIREAGLRCVFTPVARILHSEGGGKSTEQAGVRMYVQLQKSLLIYSKKHGGRAASALVKTVFVVSKVFRYAMFRSLSIFSSSTSAQARAEQARASVLFHLFGVEPRN